MLFAPLGRLPWGSFTARVSVLVVGVLAVTGLVNWAAAGAKMSRLVRAQAHDLTAGLARGTAERIAQLCALGITELATHSAAQPAFLSRDPARLQAAVAALRAELQGEFPFDGMSFVSPEGRLLALDPPAPELIGADLSQRDYVRQVLATGRPYVSDAVRARTGRLIAVLAVPVRAPDGTLAGVLSGSLHLEKDNHLSRLLAGLERDGAARYAVVDRQGTVLYATGGADGAGTSFPTPVLARLRSPAGAAEWTDPRGESVLGALAPVADAGWGVIAQVPARQAFSGIREFHRQTLLVSLATLLLAALVAWRLALALTRPLRDLIAALNAVARGQEGVRVPASRVSEWHALARAFNRMAAELDQYHSQLRERATRDPLTGVLNRGALEEELARQLALAQALGSLVSVLMIDLDDFKDYNDTYGHQAGDEVLRGLARAVQESIRPGDAVGRYGGEEFAVVLPDTACPEAAAVGERIRAALAARPFLRPVTASIGVACYPAHGDTVREVLARADEALYAAKRAGKDQVTIADLVVDRHGGL